MVTLQVHLEGTIMNFTMETQEEAFAVLADYENAKHGEILLSIGATACLRLSAISGMRILMEPCACP
jgi:hypothetical protein